MEEIYQKLIELKENNGFSKAEHVAGIHMMQTNLEQGICPRCGGKLVLRNGKNGEFYGCSNFPKCKFTRNIDSH